MERGKIHSSEVRRCHRDNTWKRGEGLSLRADVDLFRKMIRGLQASACLNGIWHILTCNRGAVDPVVRGKCT